ncbi:MAG TPA: outer membrane beta-barrel protein [Smithellaceae bacterium]|nr:outer membrane beta-barrel protein [Smithellaceae bacterium]
MKKIFSVIVCLLTLLMFTGVAICSDAAPVKKPAKVEKTKSQHLKKSELTSGPYVAVNGGVAFLTDSDVVSEGRRSRSEIVDTDFGWAASVAAGLRLKANENIRVEGELGYQKNCVDEGADRRRDERSGDIKAYSFMVNGYYDIVRGKKIVPYLTAGIGVAKVDADVNNFAHVDEIGAAYQIGAGIAYHISDNWHIDLKYRFFDTVDDLGFGNTNPEFSSHNVMLGLRYRF